MTNSGLLIISCILLAVGLCTQAFAPRSAMTTIRTTSTISRSRSLSAGSSFVIDRTAWDFVDDVFLITTTQKENQRLERTKEQLESVNLWERVKVRTFKPDDEDRVRGCYTSHIAVLEGIYLYLYLSGI